MAKTKEDTEIIEDENELLYYSKIIIFINSGFYFISAYVYKFIFQNEENWFSRLALSVVSFGIAVIIYGIDKILKQISKNEK